MRKRVASGPAFETIVAFEKAALPHGTPTGQATVKNELVVLDLVLYSALSAANYPQLCTYGWAPNAPDVASAVWRLSLGLHGRSERPAGLEGGEAGPGRVSPDHLFVHSTANGGIAKCTRTPMVGSGARRSPGASKTNYH